MGSPQVPPGTFLNPLKREGVTLAEPPLVSISARPLSNPSGHCTGSSAAIYIDGVLSSAFAHQAGRLTSSSHLVRPCHPLAFLVLANTVLEDVWTLYLFSSHFFL